MFLNHIKALQKKRLTVSGQVDRHKVTKSKLFMFTPQLEASVLS